MGPDHSQSLLNPYTGGCSIFFWENTMKPVDALYPLTFELLTTLMKVV